MNIPIKKLRPDARIPEFAHATDAGCDLFSVEAVTIAPGARETVPTGISMAIPEGYVGLFWDKSGRAVKDGITTLAGVIDSGYRGEFNVVLLNTTDQPVAIEPGEKIAQLLIQPIFQPTFEEVDDLDGTDRGEGGFGSTGLT